MELLQSLSHVENLLRLVKPRYLQPKSFIRIHKGPRMSEKEKDELDADLLELIKNCSSRINALKLAEEAQHEAAGSSMEEHKKEVVMYLLERLKYIADKAKQMQRKRYQQPFLLSSRLLPQNDRQELEIVEQKIERMRKEETIQNPSIGIEAPVRSSPKLSSNSPITSPRAISAHLLAASQVTETKIENTQHRSLKARKPHAFAQQGPAFSSHIDEPAFTEEEDRRFRVENMMLSRHFQENLEDAKQMESRMAEISNLMSQFTDKIIEQQTDLDLIAHHAQETKANVTQSNRILEQTQRIGNGYGLLIFCFYLGGSILLHLLHYFHS